jgi:nijmegen breakage syndrome protein 1
MFCERLEKFDIKVIVDYVRESTTHVVATKRNTSKGLQALINGKYIVDHSFVDALIDVARAKPGLESALETDFDSNWPNELQYLPPKGPEQIERPLAAYFPDLTARQNIFEGYTFIFYDQPQFDNLIAPITNGKGKALLHRVDPSSTTADDFVRYVKNVAGEKGVGEFEDGSEGKGVVIVRYQPLKGPALPFYSEFGRQVSLQLDHRLIEQSEFLDAILNNDASMLRRALETEPSAAASAFSGGTGTETEEPGRACPNMTGVTNIAEVEPLLIELPVLAIKTGRTRRTVTSRFKGFDDDFPTANVDEFEEVSSRPQSQVPGLFVMDSQNTDKAIGNTIGNDDTTAPGGAQQGRKRAWQEAQEFDEENILDQLAPAAANLKRLRLADEVASRQSGHVPVPMKLTTSPPPSQETSKRSSKRRKEVDILEIARLQREKEDSTAKAERDSLEQAMNGVDMAQVRKLAPIEEMVVKHPHSPIQVSNNEGNLWDEKWNGRMNFKKFRRKGQACASIIHKVIVPLQEVKKKDFGIGEDYWLEGDKDHQYIRKGRQQKDNINDTQRQSQRATANGQIDISAVAGDDENTDRESHLSQSALLSHGEQSTTQSTTSRTGRSSSKRTTTEIIRNPAPTKKPRHISQTDDSDDSDEGLGFRFRKRT